MHKVAVAILKHQNEFLIAERKGGDFDHFWEFPGGKLEFNETPLETIKREIFEELNLKLSHFKFKNTLITNSNNQHIKIYIFECTIPKIEIHSNVHYQIAWVKEHELKHFQIFPNLIEIYQLSKKTVSTI